MKNILTRIRQLDYFQALINVYTFIFVFTMVNREFLLFGIDLRFIELPLSVAILILNFTTKKERTRPKKNDTLGKALIIFYGFAILSNLSWLWNGLEPNIKQIINENVLLFNILLGVLVFYFNYAHLNFLIINYSAIFSCCLLAVSIIAVHQGITLYQISGSLDAEYIYAGNEIVPQLNLFGENFRCAGYASDPNYATMLLLIGIICSLKSIHSKTLKILFSSFFLIATSLSFSKTIIISIIPCIVYTLFIWKTKIQTQTKIIINRLLIIGLISVIFIIPILIRATSFLPDTLSTRMLMWESALNLFMFSPFLGNGITSFRSFFATSQWYVQAHSTYWQIFSELGLIGIVLYYRVIVKALDSNVRNPLNFFLTCVLAVWIITCESIALPLSVFIYYLANVKAPSNRQKAGKNALFMVNSLKNGGAEKACLNMIKATKGYNIDLITFQPSDADANINTFILCHKLYNINAKHKFIKILKLLLIIPSANIFITAREIDHGEYTLITSHLPFSNILTRCLYISSSALYVMHTSINGYCFCSPHFFRIIIKLFLKKRKIVAVSKGLEDELVNDFRIKPRFIRTIYNPIDINEIRAKSQATISIYKPFILNVGRLDLKTKRQDRLIEIFEKGKFYKNYHLVFCGDGEDYKKIQNIATERSHSEKIHFLGYQDNIYSWMKHASIVISTSDVEAFPMNLIEALACNSKVISSDCNYGPNEILTGDLANFLVKPIDDIDQYIIKIRSALKSYPITAPSIIKKCRPNHIIASYINFYNQSQY